MKTIEEQINEATTLFLQLKVMECITKDPNLKELNYFKQIITTEDGGKYILQFQHLEGPKINLTESS